MADKKFFGDPDELTMKAKLEKLQELVVDKYIDALEDPKMDVHFRDMSPIISLLNQNNIVEEKGSTSIEEEIAAKVSAAEERRKKK